MLTSQLSLPSFEMETLSSCVSSALHLNKFPTSLHPSSSSSHHLHFISHRPPTTTTTTTTAAPNFLSSSPSSSLYSITGNADNHPLSPVSVHRKAATGYAAALIDTAQCSHSLGQVKSDVQRLSLLLRSAQLGEIFIHPFASHADKERILKEISKQAGFHRHLVALLKMFIRKNQVEMVGEVLEEFKRIYRDMMSGSGAALTSQAMKRVDAGNARRSFAVNETSVSFAA